MGCVWVGQVGPCLCLGRLGGWMGCVWIGGWVHGLCLGRLCSMGCV